MFGSTTAARWVNPACAGPSSALRLPLCSVFRQRIDVAAAADSSLCARSGAGRRTNVRSADLSGHGDRAGAQLRRATPQHEDRARARSHRTRRDAQGRTAAAAVAHGAAAVQPTPVDARSGAGADAGGAQRRRAVRSAPASAFALTSGSKVCTLEPSRRQARRDAERVGDRLERRRDSGRLDRRARGRVRDAGRERSDRADRASACDRSS